MNMSTLKVINSLAEGEEQNYFISLYGGVGFFTICVFM